MALPALGALTFKGILPKLIGAGMVLIILAIGAAAIYYVAYNKGESKADLEIAGYEKKVQELNVKQLERERAVTERVINNYHTRVIERERIRYQNRDTIRRSVPEQSRLSRGWVYAHDQSAAGQAIDPSRAADARPSETSDRAALEVVDSNYDLARANSDRHNALIDFIEQSQRASKSDQATTNSN